MATASPAPEEALRSLPQRIKPSARGRAIIFTAFIGVMGLACALPVIHLDAPQQHWRGIETLVLGPFAMQFGQFAWLANVAALIALERVLRGSRRIAVVVTIVALLFAMDAFLLVDETVPITRDGRATAKVLGLLPGYYIWLVGLALPWVCSLLLTPQVRTRADFSA